MRTLGTILALLVLVFAAGFGGFWAHDNIAQYLSTSTLLTELESRVQDHSLTQEETMRLVTLRDVVAPRPVAPTPVATPKPVKTKQVKKADKRPPCSQQGSCVGSAAPKPLATTTKREVRSKEAIVAEVRELMASSALLRDVPENQLVVRTNSRGVTTVLLTVPREYVPQGVAASEYYAAVKAGFDHTLYPEAKGFSQFETFLGLFIQQNEDGAARNVLKKGWTSLQCGDLTVPLLVTQTSA